MSSKLKDLYQSSHLYGSNAPFIEAYYEEWLEDKSSVPPHWAGIFANMLNGSMPAGESETGHLEIQDKFREMGRLPSSPTADTRLADHKEAGVLKLITTYRVRGHQAANINPLEAGSRDSIPDLNPAWHDLDESDLDREFDSGSLVAPDRLKLSEIIELCERVYCGSIGVEYLHLSDTSKREWLQQRLEGSKGIPEVNDEERLRILRMLTAAEGLEKFLPRELVKGFAVDFFWWNDPDTREIHPRYLLTDLGGIRFDRGFEQPSDHDQRAGMTDVCMMTRQKVDKEWNRYRKEASRFELVHSHRVTGVN